MMFDSCKTSFMQVISVFEDCVLYEDRYQIYMCHANFLTYTTHQASLMSKSMNDAFLHQVYEYTIHTLAHHFRTENERDLDTYIEDSHKYTAKMQMMASFESMCFDVIQE